MINSGRGHYWRLYGTFFVERLYHFAETKTNFSLFLVTLFSENEVDKTFMFPQNGTVNLQKR